MNNLKTLQDKNGQLWEQLRDLVNRAKSENRELSADENNQVDTMLAEHGKNEKDIQRLSQMESIMAQKADRMPTEKQPLSKEEEQKAYHDVFWKYQKFGMRRLNNTEVGLLQRAQTTITDSAGGYTIPQGFSNELEVAMAAWGGMLQVCRIINTLQGNEIDWPTVDDTGTSGSLLAETVQVSESDVTFAQKKLNAYTYTSGLVRVQNQLLQDSYFDMQNFLTGAFARRLGVIQNTHFTTGDHSSKPNGVVTAATVGKTSASNSTVTGAELIDLMHSVDPAYRTNARFMMNDASLAIIKKLTIGSSGADNRPLWTQDLRIGEPGLILGHPYTINQQMADFGAGAKPILFGDFQYYIIRRAGNMIMRRLDERYADYNQTGFVAFDRVDGELVQSAAIKVMRNPTT
jgi:HK97 family phage major capsid protein